MSEESSRREPGSPSRELDLVKGRGKVSLGMGVGWETILSTPGAEQYASSLLLRKEMHGGGYPGGRELFSEERPLSCPPLLTTHLLLESQKKVLCSSLDPPFHASPPVIPGTARPPHEAGLTASWHPMTSFYR